jgi:hypothetical protein
MKLEHPVNSLSTKFPQIPLGKTGTCAILISARGERSLIADLGAANYFLPEHLDSVSASSSDAGSWSRITLSHCIRFKGAGIDADGSIYLRLRFLHHGEDINGTVSFFRSNDKY